MTWGDIPEWAPACAESLLRTLKEKDVYTYYHCLRVGRLSRKLAKAMGLNEYEQGVLEMSGLLHDVGKVAVPEVILNKPGRLNQAEFDIMKNHPEVSAQIIEPYKDVSFFADVIPGVRYHHERVDGVGYPAGLKEKDVPLAAKIIAVVDTYDAMSHARAYRTALPEEYIAQELVDFSGRQFDGKIVNVFLQSIAELRPAEEDNRSASAEVAVLPILIKSAA